MQEASEAAMVDRVDRHVRDTFARYERELGRAQWRLRFRWVGWAFGEVFVTCAAILTLIVGNVEDAREGFVTACVVVTGIAGIIQPRMPSKASVNRCAKVRDRLAGVIRGARAMWSARQVELGPGTDIRLRDQAGAAVIEELKAGCEPG